MNIDLRTETNSEKKMLNSIDTKCFLIFCKQRYIKNIFLFDTIQASTDILNHIKAIYYNTTKNSYLYYMLDVIQKSSLMKLYYPGGLDQKVADIINIRSSPLKVIYLYLSPYKFEIDDKSSVYLYHNRIVICF